MIVDADFSGPYGCWRLILLDIKRNYYNLVFMPLLCRYIHAIDAYSICRLCNFTYSDIKVDFRSSYLLFWN